MARSLGLLQRALAQPFGRLVRDFKRHARTVATCSTSRQGAHHAEAPRGKLLVRWRFR